MVDDLGQSADCDVRRTVVRLHLERIGVQVQPWIRGVHAVGNARGLETPSIAPHTRRSSRNSDAGHEYVVPGAGAGDVEQMAFGVVDIFQVRFVGDRLDPILKRDDFIVAGHDSDGAKLRPFAVVCPDRFNGAAPVRTRIVCEPSEPPSGDRVCFNGAAPVRTRIASRIAHTTRTRRRLQWGRACEDADSASRSRTSRLRFILQWGRACEDADSSDFGSWRNWPR